MDNIASDQRDCSMMLENVGHIKNINVKLTTQSRHLLSESRNLIGCTHAVYLEDNVYRH